MVCTAVACGLCLLDVSYSCYRNLNVISSNLEVLTALSFLLLLSSSVYPSSPPTEIPRVLSSSSRSSHLYPVLVSIPVNKLYSRSIPSAQRTVTPPAPTAPCYTVGSVATKAQGRETGGLLDREGDHTQGDHTPSVWSRACYEPL